MSGFSYGMGNSGIGMNSWDIQGLGLPLGYTPNMGGATMMPQAMPQGMPQPMPSSRDIGFNVRPTMAPSGSPRPVARGAAGAGGMGSGFLSNIGGLEGLGSIAQGLQSLGQLYGAVKGMGLAKDQLNFQKQAYNTNLANTSKAYNTALEDRVRARSFAEGRPDSYSASYLAQNRM
jgi:hypothetical protein